MTDKPKSLRLNALHYGVEASEEIMHMHSETTKTIEFIKNNMLQYVYYSLGLQAAILAYYNALKEPRFSPFVFLLILASLLIALTCEKFTAKYFYDYKFLQYRLECFMEPWLSPLARMNMNKPIIRNIHPRGSIEEKNLIEEYENFIYRWSDPFQKMYFLANWATFFFVAYSLINSQTTGFLSLASQNDLALYVLVCAVFVVALCAIFSDIIKLRNKGFEKEKALEGFKIHLMYVATLDSFIGKSFSEIELRKELNR